MSRILYVCAVKAIPPKERTVAIHARSQGCSIPKLETCTVSIWGTPLTFNDMILPQGVCMVLYGGLCQVQMIDPSPSEPGSR